jgi:Lipocalin-like domain
VKSLILAIALLLSATVCAEAQTAKDLIGTWSLVSITVQQPDNGAITNDLGPNPQGRLDFDANGNYSLIVMAGDLPKFAENSRDRGTPAEDQAVVKNNISHFDHYSVSNGDITFEIEYSTFPNCNAMEQ